MFPPKKKKGIGIGIAIPTGKPKGDDELSAPGPLEGKTGPPGAEEDTPETDPAEEVPSKTKPDDYVSRETPDESADEEQDEEYSGDLLTDATKPLIDLGLTEEDAKATLAQIFKAVGKCLERGSSGDDAGDPMAAAALPSGGPGYGR